MFIDVFPKKNISWALKQFNLSRSTYYDWQKRYSDEGFVGLIDKPPIPHSHPDQLLQEEVDKILAAGKRLDLNGYRTSGSRDRKGRCLCFRIKCVSLHEKERVNYTTRSP
jgi:transposase